MTRPQPLPLFRTLLACLLLSVPGMAAAQAAPANVVTPAPPPREGTVGPEQLRDFSLPGTRTAPPAAAPAPATATRPAPTTEAPVRRPEPAATPAPRATAPARLEERPAPVRAQSAEPAADRLGKTAPASSSDPPAGQVTVGLGPPEPAISPVPLPEPVTQPAAPVAEEPSSSGAAAWWSPGWLWLVIAALLGIALSLLVRRRRGRPQGELVPLAAADQPLAGPGSSDAPQAPPAPAASPTPRPAEGASEPPLPAGLVTTRLRSAPPAPPLPEEPSLPAGVVSTRLRPRNAAPVPEDVPAGAVVSTRLRPWLDLDLALSDVILTGEEALLRFRLSLLNSGMAAARDIVIEALPLNAGITQGAELASFFDRPDGAEVAVRELARLETGEITHEVRMPKGAIREYEAQGRRLFVPILAFNVGYRWAHGSGRTSAAFLVGHEQPGSERLAPIRLDAGSSRLTGLGVRRLEEQIRR